MATTVVDVIKVTLDDERVIACKPLKIKYLRPFMERISDLQELKASDNAASLDILVDCCEIALQQYIKGGIAREDLEDLLDLPTMYRIIEGASNIVLDDQGDSPN